ncbi:MAG: hypothetical protein RL033_5119, partial [Pseudomonadota bacterium]
MSHSNIRDSLSSLSLLVLVFPLYACGNETVDLGGGRISQQLQRGARCADSPIVAGSVRVTSQADLAQLEGCEEIDGDLIVDVFAGADLSPLASLRVVDGLLQLGAFPALPEEGVDTSDFDVLQAEINQIFADGYLPSLAGLESLERVASLDLSLAAEDLSPLHALRELRGQERLQPAGLITIHGSQIRTLRGLENIESIRHLSLITNPELESLGGIALDSNAGNIELLDSPKLTSLAELAHVQTASSLNLTNVGITDLDDLTDLSFAEFGISLMSNRQLRNIDRLADIGTEFAYINDNAVLQSIPALNNMQFLEAFTAVGNPALQTIELALPEHASGPNSVAGRLLTDPVDVIDIGDNAQLTTVSISAGLAETRFLALYENPSLTSVTLGTLTQLESLELTANPSLATLDLGPL